VAFAFPALWFPFANASVGVALGFEPAEFGSRAQPRASAERGTHTGRNASPVATRADQTRERADMRGSHLKTANEAAGERQISVPDNDAQALSFDAVIAEHGPYVWRVLRRLGVRTADIEDVWQETFIVVHRKLGSFEGRAQLRTWLSAIAVRVASDYRSRAYRRREQATDELPDAGTAASQQEGMLDQERRALLDRLMAELKPEQREVVVLYEFAELPMQEVAEALGCPLQTAYSRLHAGRRALEQAARREAAKQGSR
jgi:RNA polymerase sigma-70 factor, ECF subfamily